MKKVIIALDIVIMTIKLISSIIYIIYFFFETACYSHKQLLKLQNESLIYIVSALFYVSFFLILIAAAKTDFISVLRGQFFLCYLKFVGQSLFIFVCLLPCCGHTLTHVKVFTLASIIVHNTQNL